VLKEAFAGLNTDLAEIREKRLNVEELSESDHREKSIEAANDERSQLSITS
jgi:hypothetical protein